MIEETTTIQSENNYFLKGLVIVVIVLLGALIVIKGFSSEEKSMSSESQLTTPESFIPKTTQPTLPKPTSTSETTTSNLQPNVDNKQMKSYTSAPKMQLEAGKKYTALLKTTDGDLTIELFADKTPITVNNFVFLANDGFYNGVKFHRIIKDFMVQTGDPEGTGRGGPGYKFNDEAFTGEYVKGTVAMANAGPNTNGSQFFIMTEDVPIQKNYVIFGKLADEASFMTLSKIANTPVFPSGEGSTPKTDVLITGVEITAK